MSDVPIATAQQTKPYCHLTPDRLATVIQAIQDGYSLSGAAKLAGVDRLTLYRHRKANPDLERAIEECKPIGTDFFADAMREKALQPNGFLANIAILKARDRATWGDHVDVRQTSSLRIELVLPPTPEELLAHDAKFTSLAPPTAQNNLDSAIDAEYELLHDADSIT